MKKRLLSMILTVLLVVSMVCAVPAAAAGKSDLPRAVRETQMRHQNRPDPDGASVMSESAFRYLAGYCMTHGQQEDTNIWILDGSAPVDGTDAELGFSLVYHVQYDAIELYSWVFGAGMDEYTAVMLITPAAEAPFEEYLYYDEDGSDIGLVWITQDYDPDGQIWFSEYYADYASADAFVNYNSMCCAVMTGMLQGVLEEGGYTLEDLGLVAAARSLGVDNRTPFNDVRTKDFFYTPVLWALQNNVTQGTGATTFSPGATCTRAQVVTFLWRAAGSPEPTSGVNPFVDVDPGQWYGKAVLWAVEKGITVGVDPVHFGTDVFCTRGQVVTFLCRAAGNPAPKTGANPFSDVDVDEWYGPSVLWAVENGITAGISPTLFAPSDVCTRGQIVTFLWRAAGWPAV